MDTIEVSRADGVVTVTLNRPQKLNAMNETMFSELSETLAEVAGRSADRVVVLTGAGDAFCSGADLGEFFEQSEEPFLARMRAAGAAALAVHRLAKPTIAAVNGVAVGAGANLAFGCDLVVASSGARFSEIFSRRGLSVDFGGSWLLPRLVGLARAKQLVLLADMLSAEEAQAMGLVSRVVPPEELSAAVSEWAQRLAEGPPLALSMSKLLLDGAFESSFDQAVEAEAQAQAINFSSDDAQEALRAYAEKRQPRFRGR